MRLLIADDEAPLRSWLRRLLAEAAPDAVIVAECGDGSSALAEIERLRPDAAFLDIRMPGLSGLEVAARLDVSCRVVFVTAYDEFAIEAFERAALDYLLKPVTAARLAKTLQRLRAAVPAPDATARLARELLAQLNARPAVETLRWLRVGAGDTVRLLAVEEVDSFEAADKYTLVRAGAGEWLIRTTLKELESRLDPQAFWRIHRGVMVRVAAIAQVRHDLMGKLWVEFHSGGKVQPVSRAYAHLFRQM
ncbi:MAG: response regulator transcription factor [Sulfuricella sp.]|nr:response regulator transcription factor [Sulfuricella sp.]